jgi:hypothetical protein
VEAKEEGEDFWRREGEEEEEERGVGLRWRKAVVWGRRQRQRKANRAIVLLSF